MLGCDYKLQTILNQIELPMITNFLKNGFSSFDSIPIIASMQGSQSSKAQPSVPVQLDKIVEQTLSALNSILTDKLGEAIDPEQLKQLSTSIMKSKNLQANLIETKQRYNDLVNKSTSLYQQARKISSSIAEFITSINMFLESDELLVPLNEIQKGINELIPQKVEKQINYLVKIFANNFQEIIDKNVRIAEKNLNEEIRLIKNLNKNLETQIINIKNNKNNDESNYLEQTMKITALNQKVTKLINEKGETEKEIKQNNLTLQQKNRAISELEAEVKRLKGRQGQLLEKIKQIELKSVKAEKMFRDSNNQSQALNIVIEKLKQRQEEIVEELEAEFRKKEIQHEALRKKLCSEKAALQEKIEYSTERSNNLEKQLQAAKEETQNLTEEVRKYRQSGLADIDMSIESAKEKTEGSSETTTQNQSSNEPKPKLTLKDLLTRISFLEKQNKEMQATIDKQRELGVNKEVFKGLFLSYDDQSKEWAVRRNIKYQIYTLLDLRDKIPKPEQPKGNKWFGLF